jgi:predicted RNA-binding Zn ribbon-like protein
LSTAKRVRYQMPMANRPQQPVDTIFPAPDGDLCLAYANTRYWRGTTTPNEDVKDPDDLLRWATTAERLPGPVIERVGAHWRERPGDAAAAFSAAIALREAIYRSFAATAGSQVPSDEDVATLNGALAMAPPRQRLRLDGWVIGIPAPSVSVLLAPTLWSAADLLVRPQLQRVRQCSNQDCGWLFLDNSKSGNRRWCSMSACGNRAKAHRHYLRQKGK